MTKHQQIKKNIDLSERLADYIASHPMEIDKLPKNASFVAFSSEDENLNKANNKLIEGLLEEGKKVIKAIQTNSRNNQWTFSSVAV